MFKKMKAIVLGLLGIKEFSKDESGNLTLSVEESNVIADVLGQPFVDKFREAMAQESVDPQPLLDAITDHNATQNSEQLTALQTQLDQANKDKERLQASILQLSNDPEPETTALVTNMPRKQGVKSIMKVDMSKPHYQALSGFLKSGYMAAGATINVDDLMSEFGTYLSQGSNNFAMLDSIFNGFTSSKLFTEEPAVTEFRSVMPLITSVSQQFVNKWTPSGESKFEPMKIQNRRHKLNVPIIPSNVLTSYIFKLYRENLAVDQMPIFYYIWQNLIYPQLMQDIELRMIWKGRFEELPWSGVSEGDPGQAPEKSMDGAETIVADNFEAGNPNKMNYFDGGNFDWFTATDEEVLEFVAEYDAWMAPIFQSMVFPVLCSKDVWRRYRRAYKNIWGEKSGTENHNFGSNAIDFSNKYLVPVDGMYGSPDLIATPPVNLVKLRHINGVPAVVNDVQKKDYEARIFGEYWMGAGYQYGPMVFAYHKPGYDPHSLVTSVYGDHDDFQQFKGTDPNKSVNSFGSGSAGAGI
ncbi:hypothetical protein GCM10027284_09490 [Cyclobacterium sediminis]